MTFTSFNIGAAVNVTFGDGHNGTVKTLDQLNAALLANNLRRRRAHGKLTISATNDYASSTLVRRRSGGRDRRYADHGVHASRPHRLRWSTLRRRPSAATWSIQFNGILAQITTTSQDASFNGVNLLGGDQLKLTFNETGKSTLEHHRRDVQRGRPWPGDLRAEPTSTTTPPPTSVIANLNSASTLLRTQASALGSNLSIVQIRQDFSKNLINVLQTGSSNLTLADTNEEAANSQALSTRQSIAVSALALANQSQQSVLQLLR